MAVRSVLTKPLGAGSGDALSVADCTALLRRGVAAVDDVALSQDAAALGRHWAGQNVGWERFTEAQLASLAELAEERATPMSELAPLVSPLFAAMSVAYAEACPSASAGTAVTVEQLKRCCESAPLPMMLTDRDWCCEFVNSAALALVGCHSGDCRGRRWLEWVDASDRERVVEMLRLGRDDAEGVGLEFRTAVRDSPTRWLALRGAPLDAGVASLRVTTLEDVTERHIAEEALRRSEQKFRALAEAVPAAIFIVRGDAHVYVNGMMELLTGYDRDELAHTPVWEIVHPDYREASRALVSEHLSQATSKRGEAPLLTKAGELRWVTCTIVPIVYEEGPALLGAALDITARKAAEQAAQERQNELLHVSRVSSLGKMASEIAHELNQPLAAIVNYAEGCERRIHDGERAADRLLPAIEEMRAEAQRAGQIIKRIRAFVQKRPASMAVDDLNRILREALELASCAPKQRGVTCTLDLADDLGAVCVDRILITQIIVNLTCNALDAMADVEPAERRLAITSRRTSDGFAEVRVRDNGSGLSGMAPERLFEPFVTTKRDGLGLGLSICRSIVEAHGGRLWAEANDGPGAAFYFSLPIVSEE